MTDFSVEQALIRAHTHLNNGECDSARALFEFVLAAFPNDFRAEQGLSRLNAMECEKIFKQTPPEEKIASLITTYNEGRFLELVTEVEDVLAEYPSSFVTWNILGTGQRALGRVAEAERSFRKATELNPAYADGYFNMANILQEQGKFDGAIEAYLSTLEIQPLYAQAQYNIGVILKAQGKLDMAIDAYLRALKINPAYANAHFSMGNALQEQGKFDEAIEAYKRALEIKPASAGSHFNMGNALLRKGELKKALAAYYSALEVKPDYADAHFNIGVILQEQAKMQEANAAYQRVLDIEPAYVEAHCNIGATLKALGRLDEAIEAYQRALDIKPDQPAVEAQMLHLKRHVCDFTVVERVHSASIRLGIETEAVPPFAALPWEDNPSQQLLRAKHWSRANYKHSPLPLPERATTRPERLRVGYFSADFHDHATMYLMAGLLRQHDNSTLETFAYSYGRNKSGDWRKRAENDVDHFFNVTGQAAPQIVDLVRSHALDIAIDLKGYTQHGRTGIFKYRLAPIQINFLGYPGSLGADFFDYIIADPVVIPNEQRQFYTEKVIYLPYSYQPNDNERPIAAINTTRSDVGLPEDAFVFCCFNNNYKISQAEFEIWMRLLHQVEGSVLWLLRSNRWAESNLRKEAAKRGIDPLRLVFAPQLPHSEHLARHKHADLFVDTFNVNAHTTASDALWSGLPVVTKQGKQFAARVAASLLTAVRLPELIANSETEYEHLILDLATHPEKLAVIRRNLAQSRLKAPLFDTTRYVRNFENALQQAYDIYFAGMEPSDIWISDRSDVDGADTGRGVN